METLLEVGRQLDRDIYPEVLDGGIVMPNNADISLKEWAKEKEAFDEAAERQRRSEARSRSRTTRRKAVRSNPTARLPRTKGKV